MILVRRYKDNSTFKFNYDLYAELRTEKRKTEYTVDDLQYPFYKNIIEAYYKSPWHKIKKFKYNDKVCTCIGISIVYDTGFVLRLNYQYTSNKNKIIKRYVYIQNINSAKFLRLLKFKDIQVIH